MDKSVIGIFVFIATWVLGRILSERALKTLTENERGKLLKGLSKYRIFSLIGVIVLVVLYYSTQAISPNSYFTGLPIFVGSLVLYLLGSSIFAYKKLKDLEMPDQYVNQFLVSTLIQYVGIFVFFGFLLDKYR